MSSNSKIGASSKMNFNKGDIYINVIKINMIFSFFSGSITL